MEEEFGALKSAVGSVDGEVRKTLLDGGAPFHEVLGTAPKKEGAKLCVSLAYTLGTLYYTLLRAHGESTKEHGISEELDRIKSKFVAVQKYQPKEQVEGGEGEDETTEETLRKRSLEMARTSVSSGDGGAGTGASIKKGKNGTGTTTKRAFPVGAGAGASSTKAAKTAGKKGTALKAAKGADKKVAKLKMKPKAWKN